MPNDFSGTAACKALWRFESGALTADSKGDNTLTASTSSPTADTVNYREGAAAADFEADSDQYFTIADTNLHAGFPLKSGDTSKIISVCAWVKPESSVGWHNIWSKTDYTWSEDRNSTHLSTNGLRLYVGWGLSESPWSLDYNTGIDLATGQWHHVTVILDGLNKIIYVRVYHATGGLIQTYAANTIGELAVTDCPFRIGAFADRDSDNTFDGLLDEVVVFNAWLNTSTIDAIRAGTYGWSSSSTSFSSSSTSSSSSSSSSTSSSSWSYSSSSQSSAAALVWPTLSKGVDLTIGEPVEDAGLNVTDDTEGKRQAATQYYRPVHRLQLTVSLATLADRRTIQRFYLTTCAGGARVFEYTHPKSGQTYAVRFDPDTPPVWTVEPRQPDKHHAEIALLEDLRDGYLKGVYDV